MSTTIDSMTGINIRSPFFDTTASFNLFPTNQAPKKNRIALGAVRVQLRRDSENTQCQQHPKQ